MPSSAPNNAASRRVVKIVATLVAGLVVLFAVNTAQSGTDQSATALSTQSLLSLPADDSSTPPPTAIPTTAPLSLPTPTATPAPTSTPAPTATAIPTATPAPTATTAPTPDPTPEVVVQSAESQPAPTVPPAPTAAVEPTVAPEPTATAVVEPTATATAVPDPTPIAPLVEEEPTATPEPTPEPTATAIPVQTVADLEAYVLGEINQIRANAGLSLLALDPAISEVSRDWSRQMAQGGFFNHRPSDQINVMLPAGWRQWGENIASAPDIFYAQDSLEASPGHYANMVGPFTHVGIGVYTNGRQVWVTQNFARY